jgi:hypothetical protein
VQKIQQKYQEERITHSEMTGQLTVAMKEWEIPSLEMVSMQPRWKGDLLGQSRVETRGLIKMEIIDGEVIMTPKVGPLHWEIRLTKNDQDSPTEAVDENS